jgi:hypothetical protein
MSDAINWSGWGEVQKSGTGDWTDLAINDDPNAALPFDFSSPTVALTAGSLKAATYDGSTAFPITGAALDSTALASTADMGMVVAATPVTLADGPHGGSSATLVLSDYSNFQGAAGDPWSITLPGEYGSGSAGYILGTNLDVTVGSRSSHAAADVWSVEARTITGGFPTAQNIWEYPGTPTVSLAGLGDWSTFNPLADAVVLDPAYDAAKTAMQTGAAVDLSGPSMDGVAAAVGTLLPADFDTVTVSEGKIAADAVVSLTPQELATIASASKADQVVTTVAAGSHTASSFVLAAGPATDGWFGGRYWWVTVVDATNNMPGGGIVSGYVGETKTISLETALPFTPAQGDAVYILPMSGQALWSR